MLPKRKRVKTEPPGRPHKSLVGRSYRAIAGDAKVAEEQANCKSITSAFAAHSETMTYGRPSGVLPMKIALQYRDQARRVYCCVVFEPKKEILDYMLSRRVERKRHVSQCRRRDLRAAEMR